MTIHENIKNQIKEALRAKDTIRLDTLRGLNALALNELISNKSNDSFLTDDKMLALVRKSVKQRKDSISQFTDGGRIDLASKEQAELGILESFMPEMMTLEQVKIIVRQRIDAIKSAGNFDPKASGKITGMIMKELAGKADGNDVMKAVIELIK
ncbi:MAG: GatB/YqeY domain-containing protein [Candidatus Taylorbacteria bacterium]